MGLGIKEHRFLQTYSWSILHSPHWTLGDLIGNEGASILADSLKINSRLTSLNLRRNVIGNEGASYLAESLKINSTLTSLDLSWNVIRNEGVLFLTDALKINSTLTTLFLRNNHIGKKETLAVVEKLKINKRIPRYSILEWNHEWEVNCKSIPLNLHSNSCRQLQMEDGIRLRILICKVYSHLLIFQEWLIMECSLSW